jgi:hypothetical protein
VIQVSHPNALRLDTLEENAETIVTRIIDHVQRVQCK